MCVTSTRLVLDLALQRVEDGEAAHREHVVTVARDAVQLEPVHVRPDTDRDHRGTGRALKTGWKCNRMMVNGII